MQLSDQVISLADAKRLKELGVTSESLYSWFGDETKRLMDNGADGMAVSDWMFVAITIPKNNQERDHREDCCLKPSYPAYTVAELLEQLPDHYAGEELGNLVIQKHIVSKRNKKASVQYYGLTQIVCGPFYGATIIECLCSLYLHLLENKIIKI